MKRCLALTLSAGFAHASLGTAQAPASICAEIIQAYTAVKIDILKSAEKMPPENYSFTPTPGIRSFADVLDHVADSQMRICSAVIGDKKTPSAAGKTTKAEITAALDAAFAECDKAYGSLSDANAGDNVTTTHGQRSKLGALTGNLAHDSEQYGILAMYLRLKGIVPPSSDKPGN